MRGFDVELVNAIAKGEIDQVDDLDVAQALARLVHGELRAYGTDSTNKLNDCSKKSLVDSTQRRASNPDNLVKLRHKCRPASYRKPVPLLLLAAGSYSALFDVASRDRDVAIAVA